MAGPRRAPVGEFRWTLGRRLNFLLLAIAPLPLVALLVWSTALYESKLHDEADRRLEAQAKSAGLEVYRRLVDLEADLRRAARADEVLTAPNLGTGRWSGRFRRVESLVEGGSPLGVTNGAIGSGSPWTVRLESNQAVLVETTGADARPALWLAVTAGRPDRSALWGEIELDWLWTTGALPSDSGIRWLLLGARSGDAIAAAPGPEPELEERVRRVADQGVGGVDWKDETGARWRARFVTIPLGNAFGHPGLVAAVGEIDRVGSEAAMLRRTSWLVALGALALAGLLVTRRLENQLRPLTTLLDGTRRLAAGDLATRIEITGPADLAQLGSGFNRMAEELDRSFHLLEAGNEVAVEALGIRPEAVGVTRLYVDRISAVAPTGLELVVVLVNEEGSGSILRPGGTRSNSLDGSAQEPAVSLPAAVRMGPGWVELEGGMAPLAARRLGERSIWRAIRRDDRVLGAIGLLGFTGSEGERRFLGALEGPSAQLGLAISRVHLIDDLERANWGALTALARAVDAKSPWTRGHSERVTGIAMAIGEQLGLSPDELRTLRRGTLLHDVGKIGVPSAVLDKRDRLTGQEIETLKSHVEKGGRILEPMEGFRDVMPIVWQHHERLDGSGYPRGLRGAEIDRLAALVAVADVFEALSASRPYRAGRDPDFCLDFLRERAGTMFDPATVDALARARLDVERWPYPELLPAALRTSTTDTPGQVLEAARPAGGELERPLPLDLSQRS